MSRSQVVLRSAGFVVAATIASRVLGLVREALVASRFGANSGTDAYFVAFRIPDILFNSLLNFVVAAAFTPVFTEILARKGMAQAGRLTTAVLLSSVGVLLPFTVLLAVFAPGIVAVVAPGLGEEASALAASMTRIMVPIILFGAVAGVWRSALNAVEKPAVPALIPLVYNVAFIATILALSGRFGILVLSVATLAGAFFQISVLAGPVRELRAGAVSFRGQGEALRKVAVLGAPVLAGLLIGQAMPFVETALASKIGEASISYLGYAYRLFLIPEQLFTVVISAVVFPLIARQIAASETPAAAHTVRAAIRMTALFMLPVAVICCVFSDRILILLLGRGAFDERAVRATSAVFIAYSCGLLPVCIRSLLSFGFFAARDAATLMRWTAVMVPVNILLDLWLIRHFASAGLAAGTSLTAALQAAILARKLGIRFGTTFFPGRVFFLKQAFSAAALAGAALALRYAGLTDLTAGAPVVEQAWKLAAAVLFSVAVYAAAASACGIEEIGTLAVEWRRLVRDGLTRFSGTRVLTNSTGPRGF